MGIKEKKKTFTVETDDTERLKELENVSEERWQQRVKARRKLSWKRIGVGFMVFMVGLYCVAGVGGLWFAQKLLKGMPELRIADFISEESSKIYDANGTLVTEIGTYYRENITYEDCPEVLIDAFLAVEDSRFFSHNGFDIPRFSKAAIETLIRDNTQGGSTFTMQLVKNTYFSIDDIETGGVEREATLNYKAQQIILSMELEQYLDKRQIFELFLNKMNFGQRIRGIEKAAQYYFNKHTNQLNLSESALLAGIINLPNGYNPYDYLDQATTRRNEVLDYMVQHGYIDEDEAKLAKAIKVEDQLVGEDNMRIESHVYAQYVDAVLEEVMAMTGCDPVYTGMQIYTALIPGIQEAIEDIENEDTDITFTDDLMQCAIITVDNRNGEIVGIGGGRFYSGGSRLLNRATSQYKQPGSSVKPFLSYALAFEYLGYSMDEILEDKPITYPGESRILVNATDNYAGNVSIRDAVGMSLNIPAILTLQRVQEKVGSDVIVKYLRDMGITHADYDTFHLSYAIGANQFEMTVKELAGAHATMINLGVYNEPHTVRKVEMESGETFYPQNQNVRVLSPGSCYLVDMLMNNNVNYKTFNFMQILQRSYPVYAKTGTTDWGSDGLQFGIPQGAAKDKLMVASTSTFTNAVWIGYDKGEPGGQTWLPMWKINLNLTGRINSYLIDAEEEYADDLSGVSMPSDVTTVSYVQGTFPHVMPGGISGSIVTSMCSEAGLENSPLITGAECNNCRITNYKKTSDTDKPSTSTDDDDDDPEPVEIEDDPEETTNTSPPAQDEPAYTVQCADGSWHPEGYACPVTPPEPQYETCWDGVSRPVGTCPAQPVEPETEECWDGSTAPIGGCPPQPQTEECWDGSTAPIGGCPPKPEEPPSTDDSSSG